MQLFADYIEPLTAWLTLHPNWALLIAFLIAFIESLAIIGSIIPGTIVMTAVGILAGSGVMRIDLTFLVAALGAIIGDTASYALGYTLSDRITQLWPFSRYPKWLLYGQTYFESHGGKSVLLGRFIGPLRSIIPVIAGMLKMKRVQFLVANIISGIAWSVVYITPGILIGAASAELSTEGATRLFILILVLLVSIWLLSIAIKWLFARASHFFRTGLHEIWSWLEYNPYFSHITHHFTPPNEGHHATTAALTLLTLLSMLLIIAIVLWFTFVDELGYLIDLPVYFFFQSLRTQLFDGFFVLITCFINAYSLLLLWCMLSINLMHTRNWRLLRYWISLGAVTFFCTQGLAKWMNHLRLHDAPLFQSTFSFPSTSLAIATALFCFLLFQINHPSLRRFARIIYLSLSGLLILDGFALLYLGDHWTTSILISYAMGFFMSLLHWVFYRRQIPMHPPRARSLYFSFALFILMSLMIAAVQFKAILRDHYPYPEQYVLTSQAWWHQKEPLLPIYTMNRFGQPNGVFNIQYLGSLTRLQKALEAEGWKQRPNSFAKRFLSRANHPKSKWSSFKAPLYLNQKPALVMTYEPQSNRSSGLALSLWRSNYHLRNHQEPIWLGSLQPYPEPQKKQLRVHRFKQAIMQGAFSPFHQLLPALEGFEFNTLPLPTQPFQSLPAAPYPLLLIIKETP
ncbi:MAG: VTT domain-containing protein [Gammaproteobacteria bacterium]|nr:VTT domain-containing protein [Gammaproteobacteria bacterium]